MYVNVQPPQVDGQPSQADGKQNEKELSIGGCWVDVDRNLNKFYSIKLNVAVEAGAKLVMFENKFKEAGSKQPDYRVFLARKRDQNG